MNIKDHFISRYPGGKIIEADWSQLEVVVFAFLTQDRQLMRDITLGVDIHKVMYSRAYDVLEDSVTTEQRKGIKQCTFHVIYGGGAKSMSTRMELDEDFCKKFIGAFYDRYPMAKSWQDQLVRTVNATKTSTGEHTDKGQLKHRGQYKSLTGRIYSFETQDSPLFMQQKGEMTSFNPPMIKNYPVQGFATADIHMIAVGMLFREAIKHRDKFVLINTVHDSVVVDCREEYVDEACIIIKTMLECIRTRLQSVFGIEFNLPLGVELKTGDSWADMNKYNF